MALSKITNDSLKDTAVHGVRNLIINGAMQVAQRGTSSSNSGIQAVDRIGVSGAWNEWIFTQEQSSDAPAGFSNSFKLSTTTAEVSLDAGDLVYINQGIEAQNLQHLKYGASGAETCTLSFWVKSSIAGVFGISLYQDDGSYILTPTYTINAANTWEYKTISVSGNTLGAPANDNGNGIRVSFIVAAGSSYNDGTSRTSWESYSTNKFGSGHVQNGVMTTLNATFQITGVQLELGETATPFEHRSFGDELARCQRYYYQTNDSEHSVHLQRSYNGLNYYYGQLDYPVTMRSQPTLTFQNASASILLPSIHTTSCSWYAFNLTNHSVIIEAQPGSDAGAYTYTAICISNSIRLDAEL